MEKEIKGFLERLRIKKFEAVAEQHRKYFIVKSMLDDFRYTSFAICSLMVELYNFNNLYKLVEGYDFKRLVMLFKGIVKNQGVNSAKEVRERFINDFTQFSVNSKTVFTTYFKEEYKTGADILNSLTSMILFCQNSFKPVLNSLDHKKEFLEILDLTVDFMILVKDKIKKPKVSKYQKYAGVNLKHWRSENGTNNK